MALRVFLGLFLQLPNLPGLLFFLFPVGFIPQVLVQGSGLDLHLLVDFGLEGVLLVELLLLFFLLLDFVVSYPLFLGAVDVKGSLVDGIDFL